MITRIVLENYMSHGRTVIEPAAGLTVLAGPNNCGKSAVVSALQTVCGDHDGDFMVRHGEKSCQVTVETSDGHSVTWRRIKGKVSYVIDGREVHRVGKGNLPDGLDELLQLAKVQHPNGRDEFDVHFGNQKAPIFLIDREGDAAAFFSTSSDAEKLLEVQKRHKQKVVNARRDQRELTGELGRLDGMLAALSPLDELDVLLGEADREHAKLLEAEGRAGELGLLLKEISDREAVVGFYARQREALGELRAAPGMEETGEVETHVRMMGEWVGRLGEARGRCESLAWLAEPPEMEDVAALTALGKNLSVAVRRVEKLEAAVGAGAALAEPPVAEDTAGLARDVGQLEKAAARGRELRGAIESIDQSLSLVDGQINEWLWANPTCPTCGGKTTRETLLSGGHVHAGQSQAGGAV